MGWITAAIPSTYDDSAQYAADREQRMWNESHQFTLILKGVPVRWIPHQRPMQRMAYNLDDITPEYAAFLLPADVSLEQMMAVWPIKVYWFKPVPDQSETWSSQTWDAMFDACVERLRQK